MLAVFDPPTPDMCAGHPRPLTSTQHAPVPPPPPALCGRHPPPPPPPSPSRRRPAGPFATKRPCLFSLWCHSVAEKHKSEGNAAFKERDYVQVSHCLSLTFRCPFTLYSTRLCAGLSLLHAGHPGTGRPKVCCRRRRRACCCCCCGCGTAAAAAVAAKLPALASCCGSCCSNDCGRCCGCRRSEDASQTAVSSDVRRGWGVAVPGWCRAAGRTRRRSCARATPTERPASSR